MEEGERLIVVPDQLPNLVAGLKARANALANATKGSDEENELLAVEEMLDYYERQETKSGE